MPDHYMWVGRVGLFPFRYLPYTRQVAVHTQPAGDSDPGRSACLSPSSDRGHHEQ